MMDKWDTKMVAARFEEAVQTLKKLPPVKIQGYISKWPPIKYTPNEMIFQEKQPLRLRAAPDAISRMDETCSWMFYVNEEERKLLWMRATKTRWKSICYEIGCDRTTAWRKWVVAISKIVNKLNRGKMHCAK